MLTLTYIAFAVVGCLYILISTVLGHMSDAGGSDSSAMDAGGHSADQVDYGVDGGGHGSASADGGAAGSFHFPFFSPLALAMLFSSIGAFGLIAKYAGSASDPVSLAIALPAAVLTAYVVTYVSWRLVRGSRGSSAIRLADFAGSPAEVTTPIPEGGLGEVAAMVGGQRYSGAAREEGGRAVPRGALVTVKGLVGTNLVVVWTPSNRSER